jgi:hypothetical protein
MLGRGTGCGALLYYEKIKREKGAFDRGPKGLGGVVCSPD